MLRQISKFNALKYTSSILFNVDTNVFLEDYEQDAEYEWLSDLLGEEMTKIVNQLSKKADAIKNSSHFPNMIDDLMNYPLKII